MKECWSGWLLFCRLTADCSSPPIPATITESEKCKSYADMLPKVIEISGETLNWGTWRNQKFFTLTMV